MPGRNTGTYTIRKRGGGFTSAMVMANRACSRGFYRRSGVRRRLSPGHAWRWRLAAPGPSQMKNALRRPASAVMEVDALVASLFVKYFGDAADPCTQAAYLEAMFRCGTDSLPPAAERDERIPVDDWRKPTAGRHMIDSDIMWFAWALHLEAAHLLAGQDNGHARRTLQLAGVATACPAANFAWRGHRRTRPRVSPR